MNARMTRDEFQTQLSMIEQAYGSQKYTPMMVNVIWKSMRNVPLSQFVNVCDKLMESHMKLPSPAGIIGASRDAINRAHANIRKDQFDQMRRRGQSCKWCDLTGIMTARHIEADASEATFAFICPHCSAAQTANIRSLPIWGPTYETNYVPIAIGGKSTDEIPYGEPGFIDQTVENAWINHEA